MTDRTDKTDKRLLETIDSPADLKKLDLEELEQLAVEIREKIVETVSKTGGHLAPSLGVVELTLAMHYVFDAPNDKIIWDVGHQAYAHKLITGRRDRFHTLRTYEGISGFPKRAESPYSHWIKGDISDDFDHEQVLPVFVEKAISYIGENADGDKPFFLYLPLPAPHNPIMPLAPWKGKSNINPYADFVMMIDELMGKIFKTIKDKGIEEIVEINGLMGPMKIAGADVNDSSAHLLTSIARTGDVGRQIGKRSQRQFLGHVCRVSLIG